MIHRLLLKQMRCCGDWVVDWMLGNVCTQRTITTWYVLCMLTFDLQVLSPGLCCITKCPKAFGIIGIGSGTTNCPSWQRIFDDDVISGMQTSRHVCKIWKMLNQLMLLSQCCSGRLGVDQSFPRPSSSIVLFPCIPFFTLRSEIVMAAKRPHDSVAADVLDHFRQTIDNLSDPTNNPPAQPLKRRRCLHCDLIWFCSSPCPNAPPKSDASVLESLALPTIPHRHDTVSVPRGTTVQTYGYGALKLFNKLTQRPCAVETQQGSSGINQPQQASITTTSTPDDWSSNKHMRLQTTWEQVETVVPPKALRLDRARNEIELILTNDDTLSLWICPHTYKMQYFCAVIASIPMSYRFKIGLTATPFIRFHVKSYAYDREHIKGTQGVQYEHMTILHMSHSRAEIAAWEQWLITWYQHFEPRRCANRKGDLDKNHQNEDSDSGDERTDGPHFLYVVVGKPYLPGLRSQQGQEERRAEVDSAMLLRLKDRNTTSVGSSNSSVFVNCQSNNSSSGAASVASVWNPGWRFWASAFFKK